MWKSNYMLLNKQYVKEVTRVIRIYFAMSANEKCNMPKFARAEKAVPRGKFRTVRANIKKGDLQINNLTFHLENLEVEHIKLKASRKKELIKIGDYYWKLLLEIISNWF